MSVFPRYAETDWFVTRIIRSIRAQIARKVTRESVVAEIKRLLLIVFSVVLGVGSYVLFQVPQNISWGGAGGIAMILNHLTGISYGTAFWAIAIPMLVLGFFKLGRWKFVSSSLLIVVLWAPLTDIGVSLVGEGFMLTENIVLNAIFGGIVGGISGGLLFQTGTAFPGTGVISRTIQLKTGLPLTQVLLMVDGGIILTLGAVFGWENALAGAFMLMIGGFATDYAMEGPSTTRTVFIVTDEPQRVKAGVFAAVDRGVSEWDVKGGATEDTHTMLMCTITRPECDKLRTAIAQADPTAFVTIGTGHKAHGQGFLPLR